MPDKTHNHRTKTFGPNFISSPPMSRVAGEINGDGFVAVGDRANRQSGKATGKVAFGMRLEHCRTTGGCGYLTGRFYGDELTGDAADLAFRTVEKVIEDKLHAATVPISMPLSGSTWTQSVSLSATPKVTRD